jgi:hypothetical protein
LIIRVNSARRFFSFLSYLWRVSILRFYYFALKNCLHWPRLKFLILNYNKKCDGGVIEHQQTRVLLAFSVFVFLCIYSLDPD